MKFNKIIVCLLALSVVVLSGCNTNKSPKPYDAQTDYIEESEEIVNSLEELNEAVGCKIKQPTGYKIKDESYKIVKRGDILIAEYDFTADLIAYRLRVAKTHDDLYGYVYGDYTLGMQADLLKSDNATLESEGVFVWSRWFDGKMQYSIFTTDPNTNKVIVKKIENKIHE